MGSLPTVAERSLTNLFEEALALLAHHEISAAELNRASVTELHYRLRALQNEYQQQKWGSVRPVHDRNLLMVEQELAIYIWHPHLPAHGYKLAVTYGEHDDIPYGPGLSSPSRIKLGEIVQFVRHEKPRNTSGIPAAIAYEAPRGGYCTSATGGAIAISTSLLTTAAAIRGGSDGRRSG